jgi:hypothetical protein
LRVTIAVEHPAAADTSGTDVNALVRQFSTRIHATGTVTVHAEAYRNVPVQRQ